MYISTFLQASLPHPHAFLVSAYPFTLVLRVPYVSMLITWALEHIYVDTEGRARRAIRGHNGVKYYTIQCIHMHRSLS